MALKCTCLLLLTLAVFGANCSRQRGDETPLYESTDSRNLGMDEIRIETPDGETYMGRDSLVVTSNVARSSNGHPFDEQMIYTPNEIIYIAPDGTVTTQPASRHGVNVLKFKGGNVMSAHGKTYVDDGELTDKSRRTRSVNNDGKRPVKREASYYEDGPDGRILIADDTNHADGVDVVRTNGPNVVSVNGKTYVSQGKLNVVVSKGKNGSAVISSNVVLLCFVLIYSIM